VIYRIRHLTKFRYSQPICESVMELRMQPRTDEGQRCLEFEVAVSPVAVVHSYADFLGNTVHHFDIPSMHQELNIETRSLVDRSNVASSAKAGATIGWEQLDAVAGESAHWDWIHSSHFAEPTDRLRSLAEQLRITRRDDPLKVLRDLNSGIYRTLKYEPKSTRVDSPIDECLEKQRGVCQDFAHVFIAIARLLRIPCRYVSGYLFHRPDHHSGGHGDASHAWAEALLPQHGWVGFDPANNCLAEDDHVRVAVGRDYADVPPTRGVFKGLAESELTVGVDVQKV
jgi:transglutaminase-like putative cysteine protease